MKSNKQLKLIYSIIVVCAIIWVVAYFNIKSAEKSSISSAENAELKKKELMLISKSLETQPQTEQFKSRLKEISASLNK